MEVHNIKKIKGLKHRQYTKLKSLNPKPQFKLHFLS